jgi:hypothetical protein
LEKGSHRTDDKDAPLPGTLRFVFSIGSLFLIGWFLMFWLLRERF